MTLLMCYMANKDKYEDFWKVMVIFAFFFDAVGLILWGAHT